MSIQILFAVAAGIGGYLLVRNFVRTRLRFVDAVQSRFAPFLTGLLVTVLTAPLALLPWVTGWVPALFGIGAALGASSARRALRHADWELRRLAP